MFLNLLSGSMKSVFRKVDQDTGSQDVYLADDVSLPTIEPHEVVVDIKACGLSAITTRLLDELFRKRPIPQYPASWEVSGIISQIGTNVTSLKCGDRVAGFLPLDSSGQSACAEKCILHEFDTVKLPDDVSYETAAATIGDGVKAYTALYYLAKISAGDTILMMDTGSSWVTIAVQLAQLSHAKVIASVNNSREKSLLQKLTPPIENIIEQDEKISHLQSSVMEETGGLGVNCILDNGVRLFSQESDSKLVGESASLPGKHELISCLGVGGRWVTTHPRLQLDPPNCEQLYLRGAAVCFLFEHTWTLAVTQHGRLQHIMQDIVKKLSAGEIKPNITKICKLDEAVEVIKSLDNNRFGKTVVKME